MGVLKILEQVGQEEALILCFDATLEGTRHFVNFEYISANL